MSITDNPRIAAALAAANKAAEKAAIEWLNKNADPETVAYRVGEILNKRQSDVVCRLLGFESRSGCWEVDHCNGRSGESAVGDYFRGRVGEAVKEWLDDQIGKLPKLSQQTVQSIRREYLYYLERSLRDAMSERGEQDARQMVNDIMRGEATQ